jgi:hypothetical protein
MRNSTRTRPAPALPWAQRALPTALIISGAAALVACASPAGTGAESPLAGTAASVAWDRPAADGGYACLRDTGGAGGQCDGAMGVGDRRPPRAAADGGYACLRDTGGAGGQCNAAMGLPPR